jgi:hypothetical protein
MSEADIVAILETLVEEVRTQILVIQVVIELINKRFSDITVKSMEIMHMSTGRDKIIRKSKDKINHTVQIFPTVLCLWHALKQCL